MFTQATGSERFTPLHLEWPECRNARDVGGTPTLDGRRVRRGALIRSDGHERLRADGVAAVRAYGVTRIIDLRRVEECATMPSPFANDPCYRHISVHPESTPAPTLDGIYCAMLDRRPDLFAQAVGAIADAPPGGVVVHCVAGKDRTGLVVAFALHLAGAGLEAIAADYALTDERLQQTYAEYLAAADPSDHARLRGLYRTPPEAMYAVFDHLASTYGGVDGYLERGGLTTSQVAALRARLLEE
ncbi:MAG TPA: tyrosine-protein phosphatase [Actinopolymorphaceae bacterium]